jgi:hypothetical protein
VGDGQTGLVSYGTNDRPAVRLTDGATQPVVGASVTFAVASGGGTVTDSVRVTDTDGVAQVGSWILGGTPATNTLIATVTEPGLTGNSVTFTATGAAAAYDITFQNIGPALSAGAQLAFDSAEAKWERIIYQDVPDLNAFTIPSGTCGNSDSIGPVDIDDVLILMSIDSIDGPSSVLGQAGPCYIRTTGRLTLAGVMKFDSADVSGLITAGQFDEVVLHEMGHVLGIGSLWSDAAFNCLQLPASDGNFPDTYYSCSIGRTAFDSAGGTFYTGGNKVPVENCDGIAGCGAGTRNSHWREAVFGSELMTGYLDGGVANPLSRLTASSLLDLGYGVNLAASDPYVQVFTAPAAQSASPIELVDDLWGGPIIEVDENGIASVPPPGPGG